MCLHFCIFYKYFNQKKENKINHFKSYKILVAPLDWGIGHATRCIPIIYHLIEMGADITLASDGKSLEILRQEFPHLPYYQLTGYNIRYSKQGRPFSWMIFLQIHKIIWAVLNEHLWLKRMQPQMQWDLVISDNRYGLFYKRLHSIIITHQLQVLTGMGKTADNLIKKVLYSSINRFDECWVPDTKGEVNLTGILSHPPKLPKHTHFIGPLSRLEKADTPIGDNILIVLSGPEPQRTMLENILLKQASTIKRSFILVRGLPSDHATLAVPDNVEVHNYIGAKELSKLISAAKTIICRSGYTSIMDLVKLEKKAILIPTPGQTEQEYLAQKQNEYGTFICQQQNQVDIERGLTMLENSSNLEIQLDFESYKKALSGLGI